MNAYTIIEPVLVGLIVAGSACFALRNAAPRLGASIGRIARKAGLPARLAGLFEPAAGCDSGCGACSGCGPAPKQQTVTLHRSKPLH